MDFMENQPTYDPLAMLETAIERQIDALGEADARRIGIALHHWTNSTKYLQVIAQGVMRRCLDLIARRGLLVAITLTFAQPAVAADQWFSLDNSHWFRGWRTQLQELVNQDQEVSASTLCAVGWQNDDPASLQAYVVWPVGHTLITWRPSKDDPHSLLHETNVIDLRKDVVATIKDANTSTYLVTRAWVDHIQASCRKFGATIRLSPRK
jgi:hypothetical protein